MQLRQSPWFGQRMICPCLIQSRYDLIVDTLSCVRWIDSQSINERGMSLLSNQDRKKCVYCKLMNGESSEFRIEVYHGRTTKRLTLGSTTLPCTHHSKLQESQTGLRKSHLTISCRNPHRSVYSYNFFANIKFEETQTNTCQCY